MTHKYVRSTAISFAAGILLTSVGRAQVDLCKIDGISPAANEGTAVTSSGNTVVSGAPLANLLFVGNGTVTGIDYPGCALRYRLFGITSGNRFGMRLGRTPSQPAGGRDNIVIGAPFEAVGPNANAGVTRVVDGASGTTLLTFNGIAANYQSGSAVSYAGDVDNDGWGDYLSGSPASNTACCSTVGGEVDVWSGDLGIAPARIGASIIGDRSCSDCFFCNGCRSSQLGSGTCLSDLGDIDGDMMADFVIGDWRRSTVRIHSGANHSALYTMTRSGNFGRSIASLDDLDQGGNRDFAVGAPGLNEVDILRGEDGMLIRRLDWNTVGGNFGFAVANAGDVDGDGTRDLIVGAPDAEGRGQAIVFSLATFSPIAIVRGNAAGDMLGSAVAGIQDVTGDLEGEFIVGAPRVETPDPLNPGSTLTDSGRTTLFSIDGNLPNHTRFGTGCPGSTGLEPLIGTPNGLPTGAGHPSFSLSVTRARAGSIAVLLVGLQSLMPPVPIGIGSCSFALIPFITQPATTIPTTTNPMQYAGGGVAYIDIPIPPGLHGVTFHAQWYVFDPGPSPIPGAMTKGLSITIS